MERGRGVVGRKAGFETGSMKDGIKGLTFHGFKPGWDIVPAPLCMPCSYCWVSHCAGEG
jgi:hypothetical protein